MKAPALRCMKCKRPIRKGQSCVITAFSRVVGPQDGLCVTEPWLSAVTCFREGCMTSLTTEVIREARKAQLRPVTRPAAEAGAGEERIRA